ncbi:DEHA2D07546p [Debaryomyces hansenii CBS767]|uniref:DEHA2D07546p n=1 Tax=Debaryomyces hansenii (strain ATCC 36239 / CBS 767 / BCRC 21394 / JCM 1990 / NBRC 0083 / IGC 2968) TaxID=284592 RepID=Q6BSN1_DEBHA|nr:DEHA2D07546p [Debaryomyces hansenii CBS767]CAG86933.1 DEHA2D07546p [Debaryomyces hansenii CBS767]|eukprot:XP_458789.1 DEHA2D07546p [Debaryomyces hansenii CBS767]
MPGERTGMAISYPSTLKDVTTHMFTYLLHLLLIYIYGHNRSIFGRSFISHRHCGTGQPRITFHSQLLPIFYRVAEMRVLHRTLFLISIYKVPLRINEKICHFKTLSKSNEISWVQNCPSVT